MQAINSIRFNAFLLAGFASVGALTATASFAKELAQPSVSVSEVTAPEALSPEETAEVPTEVPAEVPAEVLIEEDPSSITPETPLSTEPEVEPEAAAPIDTTTMTVVEVAGSSDAFEVLTLAIETAELSDELSAEGPFTVFAPTDEAFAALPEGMLESLLMPENKDLLVQILTYHVLPEPVFSEEIIEGDVATLEGSDITFTAMDETIQVNDATVLLADVEASNGIIHVIDQVILPPELAAQLPAESKPTADQPATDSTTASETPAPEDSTDL